ncbi:MAG TPA: hypothetical protein VL974_14545 [Magnetospirillum sp.]|jgi:hypothetical protein|nr:hypothetical protein [Magnetospirillum sp.]
MLSLVDCIAFSGLTPDQLDAVACYKHVPVIVAAEWAEMASDGEVEAVLSHEVRIAAAHHMAQTQCWEHALDEFRQTHH